MRTTITIDDALMAEAQRRMNAPNRTVLFELALEALIQKHAQERLAALGGALPELELTPRRRA